MNKILVDIYKTNNLYSGLGQFSLNFSKELIKNVPDDFIVDFLTPKNQNIVLDYKEEHLIAANFQKRYFPFLNPKYTLWHSLHQFPSHFPNKASKLILTIHDLNFIIEKSECKAASYLSDLQKNIDKAHTITVISEYTKTQIEESKLDLKGKQVHVIHNGIAENIITNNKQPSFLKGTKFFFSIGIFNEKKNFATLVPMMHAFKDYKLVIAGNSNTEYGKKVKELIAKEKLTDQIILPGKISDNDKAWLYKNCESFLFPSLAEGFGMPVIEAMREGKPVVISKLTSLPEIGGDKAFYFNSFKKEDMIKVVKDALMNFNDNRLVLSSAIKKHAEQFSWESSIKKYIALYQKIINE